MENRYLEAPGEKIGVGELSIPKAIGVAGAAEKHRYYSLLEVRKIDDASKAEVVVLDVDFERCQHPVNDIKRIERLAIVFDKEDRHPPEVLALREDFPEVPHLNIRDVEKPKSLCLFEERYEEIKLRWNPLLFLERIREWLKLTARGELHQEDQPLEPLLIGPVPNLIYPYDLFIKSADEIDQIIIRRAEYGRNRNTYIALPIEKVPPLKDELKHIAFTIQGKPQRHGIISKQPHNLLELHTLLERAGIDLLTALRDKLPKIKEQKQNVDDWHLVIIVDLPKTRGQGVDAETSDIWVFCVRHPLKEILVAIGTHQLIRVEVKGKSTEVLGSILKNDYDLDKKGEELNIIILNPIASYSRERANLINNILSDEIKEIVLIGAGTLGSQFLMNLVRMGVGKWTVIDDDCLLPHNLGRHALTGFALGSSKAELTAIIANDILDENDIAKALISDVLNPEDTDDTLKASYSSADIIIDASTSIPVARHIALDIESDGRRVSIFLNPSGDSFVLLAEDSKREITLDCIEIQYYRALINEPELSEHLVMAAEGIRYGRSCRDLSNRIPQYLVATHSAIGSKAVLDVLSNNSAKIVIWKTDIDKLTTRRFEFQVFKTTEFQIGDWTLCIDDYLKENIKTAREAKLPNETGGILIGFFDMQRRIIYVVETILSPSDSVEWPTIYIRGHEDLANREKEIRIKTQGWLRYVGEWHSHPKGCKTWPSNEDITAFSWLTKEMEIEGLPGVMLIAGENQSSWYIGHMEKPKA